MSEKYAKVATRNNNNIQRKRVGLEPNFAIELFKK